MEEGLALPKRNVREAGIIDALAGNRIIEEWKGYVSNV